MYRCLFISITIIIVLVLVVLNEIGKNINEDGDIILTPNQLRGMIVEDIVEMHYSSIYDTIIDGAVKGKTVAYFTIMCFQSEGICDYDGFQVWTQRRYKDSKPNINQELVKTRLIEKLQSSFPGSNITKGYKNCCDQYKINW
jgi:hypothetical protein